MDGQREIIYTVSETIYYLDGTKKTFHNQHQSKSRIQKVLKNFGMTNLQAMELFKSGEVECKIGPYWRHYELEKVDSNKIAAQDVDHGVGAMAAETSSWILSFKILFKRWIRNAITRPTFKLLSYFFRSSL